MLNLADKHYCPSVVDVDLTTCNFGGKHNKRTRLRTNTTKFASMGGPCNKTIRQDMAMRCMPLGMGLGRGYLGNTRRS